MKCNFESSISSNNQQTMDTLCDTLKSCSLSDESDNIKAIIEAENEQVNQKIKQMVSNITPDESKLLEHLGDYTEEPYNLIESYFDGKHLERLVRHQLESYNNFVNFQIQKTIQMFNPVVIRSDHDLSLIHI